MHVLVTGGSGFIGSHVCETLLADGHDVRVLDLRQGDVPAGAELLLGDVRDAETVAKCVRDADAVCHLAAMVGLGTDLGDLPGYAAHNDVGTAVVLAQLAASGFAGRLVLGSSMVVYGEGRYACDEHGEVRPGPRAAADLQAGRFEPPCPECGEALQAREVGEDAPMDPRNVYAATKLHQEHLCECFARETPGCGYAALRFHNVYGPRMPRDTPYAGVASIFRSALASGQAPQVFEDGAQRRDFVHVRDVAHACALALGGDCTGAFNVCSGAPRTVGDMAAALADAAGPDAPRPVVTGAFRLGDVRHVFASPARASTELGFDARIAFEDGMTEMSNERVTTVT